MRAFRISGPTVTLAASTTAQSVALGAQGDLATQVRVHNDSSAVAFLRFGRGNQSADAADFPVARGAVEIIDPGMPFSHVGVVLESGSGNVRLTRGNGL